MKNKEIEELLNSIDEIIKGASDKAIYGIQIKEYKQIKNYIEQLKQESKNNKETYGDMLYELEQENKELKKRNKELYEGFMATQEELTDYATKNEQLENNRDKAIKYVENMPYLQETDKEYEDINGHTYFTYKEWDDSELLNILKGDSK